MIKDYHKLRLPDLNKKNDLTLDVNWSGDEDKKDCQVVRFKFENGTTSFIKREDLNFFLFAIGKEEDQRKMIPQKLTKVKWYETVLEITAKKDIAKGEKVVFPIKITLPAGEETKIGELPKKKVDTGLIPVKSKYK